jgi:hypothetical protein
LNDLSIVGENIKMHLKEEGFEDVEWDPSASGQGPVTGFWERGNL